MARRIIGSLFATLDGVIQGPGGPAEDTSGGFGEGGWVFKLADDGIDETLGSLFSRPFDLLLGRRTYDIFAAYWPYVGQEDGGIGPLFTSVTKYVLSRGDFDDGWENTQSLGSMDEVAALKETEGPDLLIQGSGTLYPALLGAGLLDELSLMTFPVVLGKGKRWFDGTIPPLSLEVTATRVTEKGTIIATYRPAAQLPPYPVDGVPKPATSEREATRQRAIAEGSW